MKIRYNKPDLYRYKKKKQDFSSGDVKKIMGYMQDPKVQSYIKGLDDKGIVSFADSLYKMKSDPTFKPDILKTEKKNKIPSITYTVPKSILHPDVLKGTEHIAGDTLKLSSGDLTNLLKLQQQAQGGAKLYFDDDKDTFSYSDRNEKKLKENLTIIENQLKREKPNKTYIQGIIDEIIKIDPSLEESLMKKINEVGDNPNEDSIWGRIGDWAKKTSSAISESWNKNIDNTNKMVESPPPNLKKDPKEDSKAEPQIEETEKVELEDNLVSSKDEKIKKPESYYESTNKLNQYGINKIADIHKSIKNDFGRTDTWGRISYEIVESDPELKKILQGYVPTKKQKKLYNETKKRLNNPTKQYNYLLDNGLFNLNHKSFEDWDLKRRSDLYFSLDGSDVDQGNKINTITKEDGNYVVYDPADAKLNKDWEIGQPVNLTKRTFKTKRSAQKYLNKLYKDWLKGYKKPTEKELEKIINQDMYNDAYYFFTKKLNEEAKFKNMEESADEFREFME